jgi:hypothetical protein
MILPKSQPERKHLQVDALLGKLRERFAGLADHRAGACNISLADALLSGLALFHLKEPSLLAFQERIKDRNLRSIYGIAQVPSDTQLRAILDPLGPEVLSPCFTDIFRDLQRGAALEPYVFFQGCYLLSCDGVTHFSSKKIHCKHCLEKHHRDGTVTYTHQLFAAAIVHPDKAEVIPVCPEPILKQDGASKNDCERNAAKRFLANFRAAHPNLRVIVIEDGLSANGPHIKELKRQGMHYILGAKAGDHTLLFACMEAAVALASVRSVTLSDPQTGTLHHFRWLNKVALNESHPDLLVNLLEYWEISPDGKVQYFSWVTDLELTEESVWFVMRGGRARWKIENETFNTLKNQGYHFEHNFGHGEEHLATVLALLMMLAFLVDQVQQLCSPLFAAVLEKFGTKRLLWDRMRCLFTDFLFDSMQQLFEALLVGIVKQRPVLASTPAPVPVPDGG